MHFFLDIFDQLGLRALGVIGVPTATFNRALIEFDGWGSVARHLLDTTDGRLQGIGEVCPLRHRSLSRGVAFLLFTVDILHFLQTRMKCGALVILRRPTAAIRFFEIASSFDDLLFLAICNSWFFTTTSNGLERLFAVLLRDDQILLRLLDLCHAVIFGQSKLILRCGHTHARLALLAHFHEIRRENWPRRWLLNRCFFVNKLFDVLARRKSSAFGLLCHLNGFVFGVIGDLNLWFASVWNKVLCRREIKLLLERYILFSCLFAKKTAFFLIVGVKRHPWLQPLQVLRLVGRRRPVPYGCDKIGLRHELSPLVLFYHSLHPQRLEGQTPCICLMEQVLAEDVRCHAFFRVSCSDLLCYTRLLASHRWRLDYLPLGINFLRVGLRQYPVILVVLVIVIVVISVQLTGAGNGSLDHGKLRMLLIDETNCFYMVIALSSTKASDSKWDILREGFIVLDAWRLRYFGIFISWAWPRFHLADQSQCLVMLMLESYLGGCRLCFLPIQFRFVWKTSHLLILFKRNNNDYK